MRIVEPLSRQPLVKGERLVRSEMGSAIPTPLLLNYRNYSGYCECPPAKTPPMKACNAKLLTFAAPRRKFYQLRERKLYQSEILLRTTSKKTPRALQTSECHELLDPTKASCLIIA